MADSPMRPDKNHLEKIGDWCIRHPCWMLTLLTVVTLAPFLAKPFNMDDPLFIWAAQQIHSHPAAPYAFNVNWYGFSQPMWLAMQNPPLMSYYLAGAAGVFGWSEIGLHFACLLPAVAVVLGTWRLAKIFCQWPLFAAMTTLFAPGFLVSSTTVMSDVLMLAFWVWAVVFWTEGAKQNNLWKLSVAGTLMALAMLAKYNGICLVPLLAAYGWMEKRAIGRWAFFLLIPVAALCIHEWVTFRLYGQPHFFASNQVIHTQQTLHGLAILIKVFNALTFTGGCLAIVLFCAPWLWSRRMLLLIACSGALLVALTIASGIMAKDYSWLVGGRLVSAELQIWLWTAGGMCVLALAGAEAWQKRDSGSWLLALWVWGTFLFAGFIYWTVNGRAILPMVPAVAILIARRLEQNALVMPAGIKIAFAASVSLSLLAAQADFQLANIARNSTAQVCAKYAAMPGRLWFEGHWGFQYYMQSAGAWVLDVNNSKVKSGDVLIIADKHPNTYTPDTRQATLLDVVTVAVFPWLSTMSPEVGAGYYSSLWGPLPFAFGRTPPQKLSVYVFK